MKFLRWKHKNKRKHDRKLCNNTTAFLTIQDQEYSCTVEDISRGGALLTIDEHFTLKIGEIIEIQIPFSDSKKYVKKTAQIKRFNNKNIAIKFMW
jgi:hypothetical protein